MTRNAGQYRSEAERARRMADGTVDPDLRQQWLAIADGYLELARSIEIQNELEDYRDPKNP